jgi:hypothetical protein
VAATIVAFASAQPTINFINNNRDNTERDYRFTSVNSTTLFVDAHSNQTGNNNRTTVRYIVRLTPRDGPKLVAVSSPYFFKLFFKRIIEYRPDDVPGYQVDGNDTIVRTYMGQNQSQGRFGTPATWQFGNISAATTSGNQTNSRNRTFVAKTSDGIFVMTFHFNPRPTTEGDLDLQLNDVKWDLAVDFSLLRSLGWFANGDTELAMIGVLQTNLNREVCENSGGSNAICLSNSTNLPVGFVRWVNNLDCYVNSTHMTETQDILGTSFVVFDQSLAEEDRTHLNVTTNNTNTSSGGNQSLSNETSMIFVWTMTSPTTETGFCVWDPLVYLEPSNTSVLARPDDDDPAARLASFAAPVIALAFASFAFL